MKVLAIIIILAYTFGQSVPLVPVRINNHTIGMMMLDTGSSYTVITPKFAEKIGVRISPDTPKVKIDTVKGEIYAPLVTLESIQVGQVTDTNVEVVVVDLGKDFFIAGLLGTNFLRNKTLIMKNNEVLIKRD